MTLSTFDQHSRIGGRPQHSAIERSERVDARVAVAETWRQAMLPRLPRVDGYHLAARYLPADTVAGSAAIGTTRSPPRTDGSLLSSVMSPGTMPSLPPG